MILRSMKLAVSVAATVTTTSSFHLSQPLPSPLPSSSSSLPSSSQQQPPPSSSSHPPPPPILPPWFPSTIVSRQLFWTGATIGPMIDGLHNQCLLQYNVAPIILDVPTWLSSLVVLSSSGDGKVTVYDSSFHSYNDYYFEPHLFASSWCVPPLLGLAYIVLGGVLPRILQNIMSLVRDNIATTSTSSTTRTTEKPPTTLQLGIKAVLAVLSTAMIILCSQYLIVHPNESNYGIIDNTAVFESSDKLEQHLLILMTAAITQWAYLDGTLVAFLTASMTSFLGPLSELPFLAHHIWEYLPDAGDIYVPLQNIDRVSVPGQFLQGVLGEEYNTLALNGVTGPCYFAVTMDAIAIGRYFTSIEASSIGGSRRHRNEIIKDTIPENRVFIASSREQQPASTTIPNESDQDVVGESTN